MGFKFGSYGLVRGEWHEYFLAFWINFSNGVLQVHNYCVGDIKLIIAIILTDKYIITIDFLFGLLFLGNLLHIVGLGKHTFLLVEFLQKLLTR